MEKENKTSRHESQEEFITLVDLWRICLAHWRWFVVSLAICLAGASYYLAVTPQLYTREAAILVKHEMQGKNAVNNVSGDEFNDLGIVQQVTNITNVQRQLKSLEVLTEVVRRLKMASDKQDVLTKAQHIQRTLKVDLDNDKSTIINLQYVSRSPQHAEDVLNTVVQVYNEKWLEDKNNVTASTSRFIQDRLSLLENELGVVDDSISVFKARNKITDLDRVSDIYLQQQTASDAQILTLTNQRSMASYILGILKDKEARHQLLPTNSGINNSVAESQINQYNTMLLQLKNNSYSTSDQNPLIMKQESDLTDVRNNIIATIENHIKSIDIQLGSYLDASGEADSKITRNPDQAKYLLSIERDQKVKESLYLYLLQKKEENEINMTYTSYNTQMIDMPHGSDTPSSPIKRNILCAAILMGLFVPVVLLFVREIMDTTVRSGHDVEHKTSLPLIGEIPLCPEADSRRGFLARLFRRKPKRGVTPVVVAADKNDLVNEAFRMVRSKMEFMTHHQNGRNVYIVTSDYLGSGKTFVSMNLALVLAIKGHRVLLIDGDLRHASASHHLHCPKLGLSDYLVEAETDLDTLLVPHADAPSLHILPVGTIPPNPTELLSGERFAQMLEELRPQYDFIIIDCPPAEALADAAIMEKQADRTLFILRTGMFERKHLYDLENDVQSGKYKKVSLILNATQPAGRYGYKYKYGYGSYYGKR